MVGKQGVNLGGWLVLEKWMTPALFAGTNAEDEYAFMPLAGSTEKVRRHYNKFITNADFEWLAKHGITIVRIPIGYWIFGDNPPYLNGLKWLDWAIETAAAYGIDVIIDLHRAPGSQDGHDQGGIQGRPHWFDNVKYREQTIRVLERLAQRYYTAENIWGIGVLNEPRLNPKRFFILRAFYRQVYTRLIKVVRPGTRIIISDGFVPRLMSGVVRPKPGFPVVLDVHLYAFIPLLDDRRPLSDFLRKAHWRRFLIWRLSLQQPVIIGEWSAVISGKKMRHVGENRQAQFIPAYIIAQQQSYTHASAYTYWNYKTEGRGVWNFRSLVEDGVLQIT